MKMIDTIKQRQHRPALVIAALMLVYLWLFSWPGIARLFQSLRAGLHFRADGDVLQCLGALLELLCVLVGLVIWILSVFVTWAAFKKSKKKAYLFVLAYFLLPLVVQPVQRFAIPAMHRQDAERHAPTPPPAADAAQPPAIYVKKIERRMTLPIGPFLLLAGVWYLYRKEEAKNNEPTTGPDSQ
jgi:hypothetical protein